MPPETDNLKLQELYQADQKDRDKVYETPSALKELKHRDAMRKTLVYDMMGRGEVATPNDLYHASVILLHASEPKDYLCAHRLSTLAALAGHKPSRWLLAATLDRFLMSSGLAQVYGTQFEHNPEENKYQLRLPIEDQAVLPFEKKTLNIPPIAERLAQLNGRVGGR